MNIKGLSRREEFELLIQSIGFKKTDNIITYYTYNEFIIDLYYDFYEFHNGSKWEFYYYTDLKQLEKHFKNYFRSIKLKTLLA